MKKFYIFKDGIVKSTGFDTLEEAKQYGIASGFKDFTIFQIVAFVE